MDVIGHDHPMKKRVSFTVIKSKCVFYYTCNSRVSKATSTDSTVKASLYLPVEFQILVLTLLARQF